LDGGSIPPISTMSALDGQCADDGDDLVSTVSR